VSRSTLPIRGAAVPATFRLCKDKESVAGSKARVSSAAKPQAVSGDSPSSPIAATTARSWDDAALRIKIALLILLALIAGVGLGMIEASTKYRIWPLLLGLAIAAVMLIILGIHWACGPLDRILEKLRNAGVPSRGDIEAALPIDRTDEVGEIARIVQGLAVHVTRDHNDAKQLRRTLDDRVERATRMATRNLKELAMRDSLTGLGNRRFLDETLSGLFESCAQSNIDLVCVAIDMDNFKKINDTLGHGKGDELLRTLAQLMKGLIRHDDHAIRLGGDEFLILMPGISMTRVRQLADQLHALFRQHVRVTIKGDVKPDLSMGASSMLRDGAASPPDLLKRADELLYDAKRNGKGRLSGA